ncbi:MAG: hypothetical protein ACLVJH_04575 [Faecalibacterium prausnitzii]
MILDATEGECIAGPGCCRPPAGRQPHLRAAAGERRSWPAQLSCPTGQRTASRLSSWPTASGRRTSTRRCSPAHPGVGLLRSGYMMLPGRIRWTSRSSIVFYCSCLAAAKGWPVTVRTFDFGVGPHHGRRLSGRLQSSKLGLQGHPQQLCATDPPV